MLSQPISSSNDRRSLISSGRVKPVIYTKVYPLENLADGLQALEQRKTWGKVAVRVRDEKAKAKL